MAWQQFVFLGGGILCCWRLQVCATSVTLLNPFVSEGAAPEPVAVQDGEDAAAAALRVALEHGQYSDEVIIEFAKASKEHLQGQDGFSPPRNLVLRSGGAYMKRAEEHIKEKRLVEGAADCLRALMRPGLDPTATEPMRKKLEHALIRLQKIKDMELKDAAIENEKYAAQRAEAEALAKEWIVVLAADDQLWQSIDDSTVSDFLNSTESVPSSEKSEIVAFDVDLENAGGPKVRVTVRDGEDASHAAFHTCAAHSKPSAELVSHVSRLTSEHLDKKSYKAPAHASVRSASEHLEQGRLHQEEFRLSQAGVEYARGLQAPGLSDEEKSELNSRLNSILSTYETLRVLVSAWQSKQYQAAIDAAKAIPTEFRSDKIQLIIARSYSHLGKLKQAIGAITDLLNSCDKSGEWVDSEPRLLASVIGALLALRFGDIDKAKKMYQIVLRNDPEQKYVKLRYKALKSYTKILSDIEELLRQSKNRDVVKAVERAKGVLENVMGKEGAVNAGTRLLLFECKAKSAMPRFHDEAIEACNTAIEQFENHDNPSPSRIAEAYVWRSEANMKDKSYDDAVADLQVAMTKVQGSKEYERMFKEAKKAQDEWNKAEEQHDRRGKSQGSFYINRPSKEMLDLPDNIDELNQEEKCSRLKQAFRKMSLRWHPDKAIGGKKRAQRKSAEMGEAKSFLEVQWGCKGRRR